MGESRRCRHKSNEEIAIEWDAIADVRYEQIIRGTDLSYHHVLLPTIDVLTSRSDLDRVLDVGCGSGQLAARLANKAGFVVGIDLSARNVELANSHVATANANTEFVRISAEDFSQQHRFEFSLIVANMVLMDAPDLVPFLKALSLLSSPAADIVATITHPCFWPRYWGYDRESWFNYQSEIFIEDTFRISLEMTDAKTTHIHRPLSQYVDAISAAGFQVKSLTEPLPQEEVAVLYPDAWHFPRFLGILARKK